MVQAFATLLVCQLLGEGIVHVSSLPVPGPVVGLILLAIGLVWREGRRGKGEPLGETPLGRAANALLGHLSLLFVPAAVGIVQQGHVLAANGVAIGVALVVSTLVTLAMTAAVFAWAVRRFVRGSVA
jgi:putative effector of murein hydrolase LrgA (UPF0299 family)